MSEKSPEIGKTFISWGFAIEKPAIIKIIIKPILTEKMAIMQERQNKYAFIVSSNANKIQIKSAVEK